MGVCAPVAPGLRNLTGRFPGVGGGIKYLGDHCPLALLVDSAGRPDGSVPEFREGWIPMRTGHVAGGMELVVLRVEVVALFRPGEVGGRSARGGESRGTAGNEHITVGERYVTRAKHVMRDGDVGEHGGVGVPNHRFKGSGGERAALVAAARDEKQPPVFQQGRVNCADRQVHVRDFPLTARRWNIGRRRWRHRCHCGGRHGVIGGGKSSVAGDRHAKGHTVGIRGDHREFRPRRCPVDTRRELADIGPVRPTRGSVPEDGEPAVSDGRLEVDGDVVNLPRLHNRGASRRIGLE